MLCLPLFCLFCFLCTCRHQGLVQRVLGFPALAALAPSMYATYLMQMVWIMTLRALKWDTGSLSCVLALLGACVLSGAALHHLVERPLAPRLRRWPDHCCAPSPMPPPLAAADAAKGSGGGPPV